MGGTGWTVDVWLRARACAVCFGGFRRGSWLYSLYYARISLVLARTCCSNTLTYVRIPQQGEEEEKRWQTLLGGFLLIPKAECGNDDDRNCPIQQNRRITDIPFGPTRPNTDRWPTLTYKRVTTSGVQRTGKAPISRTATDKASKE